MDLPSLRHHRVRPGDPDAVKRGASPIEMAGTRPAMTDMVKT
ncbi:MULTISPECIES: hypothetical protein [Microvirga]|nr:MULTISPECIES: hypothetical protein [unclassified Microvirga]